MYHRTSEDAEEDGVQSEAEETIGGEMVEKGGVVAFSIFSQKPAITVVEMGNS